MQCKLKDASAVTGNPEVTVCSACEVTISASSMVQAFPGPQDVVGVRRWRVRCGLPTIRQQLTSAKRLLYPTSYGPSLANSRKLQSGNSESRFGRNRVLPRSRMPREGIRKFRGTGRDAKKNRVRTLFMDLNARSPSFGRASLSSYYFYFRNWPKTSRCP